MTASPKISVYIAISLDGFIARSDGSIDWLDHDSGGEDYGYQEFMATVDALVMGRKTFDKVLSFGIDATRSTPARDIRARCSLARNLNFGA